MTNIPKISKDTIARTLVATVALLNSVLLMLGKTPLELDENTIYECCSLAAAIGSTIWVWWKDNDIRENTRLAKLQVQTINELPESGEGDDPDEGNSDESDSDEEV